MIDTELKLLDLPRSHVAGVTWLKKSNTWKVSMNFNYTRYQIGLDKDLTTAVMMRYVFERLVDYDMYAGKSPAEKYLIRLGLIDEFNIK